MAREPRLVCMWTPFHTALRHFATYEGPTQSAQHITVRDGKVWLFTTVEH